jgi:surface polysaccharide O-acyltransferase-like enzyme
MPTALVDTFSSSDIKPGLRSHYVPYADLLRVFGALAIVFIHVDGDGSAAIPSHPTTAWWQCVCIEALCRWAVPIFVMVSGLLLLDTTKAESPGCFYKKRLLRLAVPMIFWSVFYLGWSWFYDGQRFTIGGALYAIISGSAYYHLWFIVMLAGLYLCTPLLRVLTRMLNRRQLWITTITILALAMADSVVRANEDTDFTFVFQFAPYVGLFLLGYCLKDVNRSKRMIAVGAVTWIAGAALSVVSTYGLVFHCDTSGWSTDNRLFLLDDEFMPGTLLSTVGVFTMVAAHYEVNKILSPNKLVNRVSAASLGIYLIHPMILSILNANDIDYSWHGVFVGVPLSVFSGFVGAACITTALLQIPLVKRIV